MLVHRIDQSCVTTQTGQIVDLYTAVLLITFNDHAGLVGLVSKSSGFPTLDDIVIC